MAIPNIAQPKMHSDITAFFTNGKNTLICSDYEGTAPTKQIEVFVDAITDENKQVIFLGDLFDYTSTCWKKMKTIVLLKCLNILLIIQINVVM